MASNIITQAQLKELLYYKPLLGVFVWKKDKGRAKKGCVAGSLDFYGYVVIKINSKIYKAHRLAFLYVEGEMPLNEVDHINGKRADNSWANIRGVTSSENQKNRKSQSNNTSGVMGVWFDKGIKKWRSHIKVNGEIIGLGSHSNISGAIKAREAAEIKYNFHPNHGRRA